MYTLSHNWVRQLYTNSRPVEIKILEWVFLGDLGDPLYLHVCLGAFWIRIFLVVLVHIIGDKLNFAKGWKIFTKGFNGSILWSEVCPERIIKYGLVKFHDPTWLYPVSSGEDFPVRARSVPNNYMHLLSNTTFVNSFLPLDPPPMLFRAPSSGQPPLPSV